MADKKNDPNATKEYILKPGQEHHGFKGEGDKRVRHKYVGGEEGNDRVQLRDDQYASFKDKFTSVQEANDLKTAQQELVNLQKREQALKEKLEAQGISFDDLLTADEVTIKKPDPSPSVGTPEPAPKDVVPAPVGSTPDPVDAANKIVPPATGKK